MASTIAPAFYAAFVWWFATGAVLLLVARGERWHGFRVMSAIGLLASSLYGLALTANDLSTYGAYAAFTCTILLWAAQEIAFLAGWVTGPRPLPCPADARGVTRLSFALQAILYHELALLACGVAVAALTWSAPNQVGLWTFAALWVLRQSAKINLFLGVPVTNDELMPDAVRFLKTYFARKPVGAFFPVTVTLATAVLAIMIQRITEVASTPAEIAGLTLVAALFALGIVEHWFMLLPLPAKTLWGWGIRTQLSQPEDTTMDQGHDDKSAVLTPPLAARSDVAPVLSASAVARQRLENQFRQRFIEQHDLAEALRIGGSPAVLGNGRTS